jgi:hypothetical protein
VLKRQAAGFVQDLSKEMRETIGGRDSVLLKQQVPALERG